MSATSPNETDPLAHARHLAKLHGLFIVDVTDDIFDKALNVWRYVPAWVVYRKGANGSRGVRLGRRRDPAALLRFVRTLIP